MPITLGRLLASIEESISPASWHNRCAEASCLLQIIVTNPVDGTRAYEQCHATVHLTYFNGHAVVGCSFRPLRSLTDANGPALPAAVPATTLATALAPPAPAAAPPASAGGAPPLPPSVTPTAAVPSVRSGAPASGGASQPEATQLIDQSGSCGPFTAPVNAPLASYVPHDEPARSAEWWEQHDIAVVGPSCLSTNELQINMRRGAGVRKPRELGPNTDRLPGFPPRRLLGLNGTFSADCTSADCTSADARDWRDLTGLATGLGSTQGCGGSRSGSALGSPLADLIRTTNLGEGLVDWDVFQ